MKGKTQERMEMRRWRVSDRYEKMEGHCLTGQSPLWAVEPMEEEEEEEEEGGGGGGEEGGGGGGGEEGEEVVVVV